MKSVGGTALRDLTLTLASKVGTIFIAVALQIVLARTLGPEGRGAYDACLVFATTILILLNPGTDMSIMFHISSGRMPARRGLSAGLVLSAIIAIVAVLVGIALYAAPWGFMDGLRSKSGMLEFLLALATIPTTLLFQICVSATTAAGDFATLFKLQILRRLAGLLLVVGLVVGLSFGVAGALVAIILAELMLSAWFLFRRGDEGRLKPSVPSSRELGDLFRYGARYYLGKLSNFMNFKIGALILAFLATSAELGLYGQALAVAIQFMTLSDAMFTILLPRSAGDPQLSAERVVKASRLVAILGVVGVAAAVILAEPVFMLAFGQEFLGAVVPFRILVFGFFLRSVGKTLEPYLIGADRPGAISLAVAAGLAVNAGILLLLYGRLGIVGAAWALVGNYLVSTSLIAAFFARHSGHPAATVLAVGTEEFRSVWFTLRTAYDSLRRRSD